MQQCYLNGAFLPLQEARISPLDRGFLFGDGVYEVIPVYQRQPFHWQRHADRLKQNLAKIEIPFTLDGLEQPMHHLLSTHPDPEQALYIQITRGVAEQRAHKPPKDVNPTVFMLSNTRAPIAAEKLQDGISCVTMEDFRWRRGDIKSVSLLAAVMLAAHAEKENSDEVVLLRNGLLAEGFSCNYFVIRDNTLLTPVFTNDILPGITAQVIMKVATDAGIRVSQCDIPAATLAAADEIWLTSSVREMLPVTRLDGTPVGDNGKVGRVFKKVHAAWQTHIHSTHHS